MEAHSLALVIAPLLVQAPSCAHPAGSSEPLTEASVAAPAAAVSVEVRASADFDHEHTLWTEVLTEHVRDGGFDYGALKAEPAKLEAYLKILHAVTPEDLEAWSEDERFAFWINVYNAHAIQKVVENYPISSIRKLDRKFGLESVFRITFIPMRAFDPDGRNGRISLDEVENEIMRKRFLDARLHAAINCASASCPPLRAEAFVASRLDEQLEEQMTGFVRDRSLNRFDPDRNTIYLSEIFKWFEDDFERDAGSVKQYLIRFSEEAEADLIRGAKVRYLDYDWALNDVEQES